MRRRFSEEEINFIKENYRGIGDATLAERFNSIFKPRTLCAIKDKRKRLGLIHGEEFMRIRRGQRLSPGTEFKKGHRTHNFADVGTILMREDGYLWVKEKITKPARFGWKQLHRLNWEKEHGEIPEGHKIIFLDGDRSNCDVSNLMLVSNGQLGVLNTLKLLKGDSDLTQVSIKMVELIMKTNQIENKLSAR